MMRHLLLWLGLVACLAPRGVAAFEECKFQFKIDSQSSAFQALVDGAAARGGFWRPIDQAPDDVRQIARFVGRLDICLRTPDGKPRELRRNGETVTLRSPYVTSCTATLLPDNRLLTNHHCFYEPVLRDLGFTLVDQARVHFGYTSKDFTDDVQTFLVGSREIAADEGTDALLLQIMSGDANAARGGHIPMVMEPRATARRALTMIHHPKGDPQQFSAGTCQIHPDQAKLPATATQLRHACESTGGSSGSLLLDARTLAVVGLHNQGGLGARGGFNGGHQIAAVEAALSLGFAVQGGAALPPPRDTETEASLVLVKALRIGSSEARRSAMQDIIDAYPGTEAAQSARAALSLLAPAPAPAPTGPVPLRVRQDGSGDYASISAAVAAADAGTVIEVYPGLYTGGVDITKPVEIVGVGSRSTIVWEASDDNVIRWDAVSGRIANMTLRQTGGSYYAVSFRGGSAVLEDCDLTAQENAIIGIRDGADPVIRGNRIHDGASAGVYIFDGGKGQIINNEIYQNTKSAVLLKSGADPVVRGNIIRNGKANGIQLIEGSKGLFEDNDIFGHEFPNIAIRDGSSPIIRANQIRDGASSGIFVFNDGAGLIEDNTISGNQSVGISVKSGGAPIVRNNRVTGNDSYAIWVREGGAGTYEGNDLKGNTNRAFLIGSDAGVVSRSGNFE